MKDAEASIDKSDHFPHLI